MNLLSHLILFAFLFLVPQSYGYLFLESDSDAAVVLRVDKQVIYQPCLRGYSEQDPLPQDPSRVLEECAAATKRAAEPVAENTFHMGIHTFYGIPTRLITEERASQALTDAVVSSEGSFRRGLDSKDDGEPTREQVIEKMTRSYDEILQYLEPESHRHLKRDDALEDQLRGIVIEAFTPHFSDSKSVLHLRKTALTTMAADCREGSAVASLNSLYDIVADPRNAESLLEWTAKQLNLSTERASIEIGTWTPWYEPKETRDHRIGYRIHEGLFQFRLNRETLKWFSDHSSSIENIEWRGLLTEIPGNDAVFFPPNLGGRRFLSRGKYYMSNPAVYPVYCISRTRLMDGPIKQARTQGSITLEDVARTFGQEKERFLRWAINDKTAERLLAPVLVQGAALTYEEFSLLTPVLHELFGLALPAFDVLENEAIAIEEQNMKQAEQERLAAIQAKNEERERAAFAAANGALRQARIRKESVRSVQPSQHVYNSPRVNASAQRTYQPPAQERWQGYNAYLEEAERAKALLERLK